MNSAGNALVTGGSAGLGLALCARLRKAGWTVVNCDRAPPQGSRADWLGVDLAERAELDAKLPEILARGPYDLVVHNAGLSATGRFETLPEELMLRVLRINAEAPMVLTSALEEAGAYAPGARVVFVSSLSHFIGYPGAAAFAAAKDALAVYARGIAKRFRRAGKHVLTVFPGPNATAHAERHAPGAGAGNRTLPEFVADEILAALARRHTVLVAGRAAKWAALAGWIAPALTTLAMRRLLYDRLDREV